MSSPAVPLNVFATSGMASQLSPTTPVGTEVSVSARPAPSVKVTTTRISPPTWPPIPRTLSVGVKLGPVALARMLLQLVPLSVETCHR